MITTYAIGDIHGCLTQLQNLVEHCQDDGFDREIKFIFLGDYIDRGPNSRGVIEFLIEFQSLMPNQIICLRGNHEEMLLSATANPANELHWLRNGGIQTLASYKTSKPANIPARHIEWMHSLPTLHDDGMRLFVHAGINPDKPLNQQDEHDLLWMREPFLSSTSDFGRFIVHGHTPLADNVPDLRLNRLNLDTGAVYDGPLTAAIFETKAIKPVGYLLD